MSMRFPFLSALILAALGTIFLPETARAGEIRKGLTFPSKALQGDMTFSLYLPDAYAQEPARKFPVLYLLHGYGGNDREWIELGLVNAALDRMIASGEIPPVIAVMPYGARSWYVDSAALGGPGDYESAIAIDLIDYIDHNYRTEPRRDARAIAGLSMGGYGAVRMAFFYPESFTAVVTLSGALHQTNNIPVIDEPLLVANLNQRAERKYHGAYGTPFDMKLFVARNPFTRIADLSRMQTPPKILIMTGDDDGLNFYEGSTQLFIALRRAKLQAELRVENGGHDWVLWRKQLPDMLRFLTDAMKQLKAPAVDGAIVASGGTTKPAPAVGAVTTPILAPQPAAMQPQPSPATTAQGNATTTVQTKRAETRQAPTSAEKTRPVVAESVSLSRAGQLPAPATQTPSRSATAGSVGR